jgi:shikimate kinase
MDKHNVILIGMCGVGKSTVGVLLAKALGRDFIDTDVYIQSREGRGLQQIIDERGLEAFCAVEQRHILSIDVKNAVIATGGSVVYSTVAMEHLSEDAVIIHLDLDYACIKERVTNISSRGIVMEKGQTLKSLYSQRQPLYRRWADHTVDCAGKGHEAIVDEIIVLLNQ